MWLVMPRLNLPLTCRSSPDRPERYRPDQAEARSS
jgi:hypothetical protein